MSAGTNELQPRTTASVDPVVSDLLKNHESGNSLAEAKIVDIATVSENDPYENFSIDKNRITNASQQRLKKIVSIGEYEDSIALAAELESNDVIIDFFTYDASPNTDYPSVRNLSMALGVDVSSIHHLIGKTVTITRRDGNWRISETLEDQPVTPTVTSKDFLHPLLISSLLIPLGMIGGWQTSTSILFTTLTGVFLTVFVYAFLLYLRLATKRDHSLPGILGNVFTPDYTDDAGIIKEDDEITDVEYGEFKKLHTLAPEDELDSDRAVLHNLAVDVTIPPSGKKTVPVPSPASGWDGTTIKGLVYTLAPSVETIDRATGELIPLEIDDEQIVVDTDQINSPPTTNLSVYEKVADVYVTWINSKLGVKHRDEIY